MSSTRQATLGLLALLASACESNVKSVIVESANEGSMTYDVDGDGYLEDEDCDDTEAAVNPGAAELCDGIDNDCNGEVDEDVTDTYYLDSDGDGFGDEESPAEACESPDGHVPVANDCDDGDGSSHPGAAEVCDGADNDCDGEVDEDAGGTAFLDVDGDGFGDPDAPVEGCSTGEGYSAEGGDCDDTNPAISPVGTEECDGIDNDCDGFVDEGMASTWYADWDSDGFGDASVTEDACSQPDGFIAESGDCNDLDSEIHPDAAEVCDGIDNDCSGDIDEGLLSDWYQDSDGDGFGVASATETACEAPDGYAEQDGDCDDTDSGSFPGAAELCDGVDNDCDGSEDEDGLSTWYQDNDGDGYGDGSVSELSCDPTPGFVARDGDCDDADTGFHPDAGEVCDGEDNDCDGDIDEASSAGDVILYEDADADGFGNPATVWQGCEALEGWVAEPTDCDDAEPTAYPGGTETCDGVDNDCNGDIDDDAADMLLSYEDMDGDGFGPEDSAAYDCNLPVGRTETDGDCNDADPDVSPEAEETCDGIDNDCNGLTDDEDGGITGLPTWFSDADGDGFGDSGLSEEACSAPAGYVEQEGDCDDGEEDAYPGNSETCDGIDNDCSGAADEGLLETLYADEDGDGYGDAGQQVEDCPGEGLSAVPGDCDDDEPLSFPTNPEACDGIDNDCDGSEDEGVLETFYLDADGDGFGDVAQAAESCEAPEGHAEEAGDCDDEQELAFPGNPEECDGIDNDCSGGVDEGVLETFYLDYDGDGFGSTEFTVEACEPEEGLVSDATDCDDLLDSVYPGAPEDCNGEDEDCDGDIDEGIMPTWYVDQDGDGFGSGVATGESCEQPEGYADSNTDCDDLDEETHPEAAELCDEEDNDCDEEVDEGIYQDWYLDYDGDGFGDDSLAVYDCEAPAPIYVESGGDCNDLDSLYSPGAEPGCDGEDYDCDGEVDSDADGDGYADAECGGTDCDDSDISVTPDLNGGCAVGDSCLSILEAGGSVGDGYYTIDVDGYGTGSDPYEVYCDMLTDGGGWTLALYNEFSNDSEDWYPSQVSSCGSYGSILGGWGILGGWSQGDYAQISVDTSVPHSEASLSFDFFRIDSWDSEAVYLYVDGVYQWHLTDNFGWTGSSFCGDDRFYHSTDDMHPSTVDFAHSDSTMLINFTAYLDQGAWDESWGLDNVVLWLR